MLKEKIKTCVKKLKEHFKAIKWKKEGDILLFGGILLVSNVIISHGKPLAGYLFFQGTNTYTPGLIEPLPFITTLITPIIYSLLRSSKLNTKQIFLIGVPIGLIGPMITELALSGHSMLHLILFIYINMIAIYTIVMERPFSSNLNIKVYELIFEKSLKVIQFSLVVFGVGVAALKFISTEVKEGYTGFMSTLLYPTIVMLMGFAIISYWLVLPAWNKIQDLSNTDE